VSATATDRCPEPTRAPRALLPWARRAGAWRREAEPHPLLLVALLACLLGGCAEEPLPQRRISRDDCLGEVSLDRLKEAIARCNTVVAAFPQDPQPLNERFLLHTLAEDDKAACRDIGRASELARKRPAASLDPLLREDLRRRLADCRSLGAASPPGTKAARPGDPPPPALPSPAVQQLPHQNR